MDVWIQTVILTLYCQGVLTHQNTTHTKTKQTKEFWPFVLRQLVQITYIHTHTQPLTKKTKCYAC